MAEHAATESSMPELAAGRSVLHLATYAIVSDENPVASFLALGPASGGSGADGLLTSRDVYGLDLHADLNRGLQRCSWMRIDIAIEISCRS